MEEKVDNRIINDERVNSLLNKMESILDVLEQISKIQSKQIENHEKRIIKLEGPIKYYKIDKDGNFVS